MSRDEQNVYGRDGESVPITLSSHDGPIDLTDAVSVVEIIAGRPPRPARVLDPASGVVALPDDLAPGDYRLQYEVTWPWELVQSVPAVPMRLEVKPPDVD